MEDENGFKQKRTGTKVVIVTIVALLLILCIAFVFGAFYFGIVGLFTVLGVEFDSPVTLVWFTVYYFILGIFADLLIKVIKIVSSILFSDRYLHITVFISSFFINWGIVLLINEWMDSLTISVPTQIIFAAVVALLDVVMEKKKKSSHT